MKVKLFQIFLIFPFVLFLFSAPVNAEGSLNTIISEKYSATKDICFVIDETLKEGKPAKDITRSSIELGHNACTVIICAIEGGGNSSDVITGALEAGISPDVISRCALEAGAEPDEIAGVLAAGIAPGLCYIPPSNESSEALEIEQIIIQRPSEFISSATF
jgi:hypothetical protein